MSTTTEANKEAIFALDRAFDAATEHARALWAEHEQTIVAGRKAERMVHEARHKVERIHEARKELGAQLLGERTVTVEIGPDLSKWEARRG